MNQDFINYKSLEKLYELKTRGAISEIEYNEEKENFLKKKILQKNFFETDKNRRIGQGVSLVVFSVIIFLCNSFLLKEDHVPIDNQEQALGLIILSGMWIIPHTIWLLTKKDANHVLPIIALVIIGLCAFGYLGSIQ